MSINTFQTQKYFLLLAAMFAVHFNSLADGTNKIEGAFGFKLGATFDTNSATGKSETTSGSAMYEVEPKQPHSSFNSYYVLITPKTFKIYCIWAIGPEMEAEKAKVQAEVVMKSLTEKYGSADAPGVMETFSDSKSIRQGNRSVSVNVRGFVKGAVNLRYTDMALSQIAHDEAVEIEAKGKDNSGL